MGLFPRPLNPPPLQKNSRKPIRRAYYTDDGSIRIDFDVDSDVVAGVKRISGRRKLSGHDFQMWEAPFTLDALEKLREFEFDLEQSLLDRERDLFAPCTFDPKFFIPGLKQTLHPFQLEGVQTIEWKNGNLLLADDQGLGKTGQVLAWLQYRPELRPALVVCPANLKMNWVAEVEFWMTKRCSVQVITGRELVDITADIVIINYDVLTAVVDGKDCIRRDIWKVDWKVFVADEAHYASRYLHDGDASIRGWAIQQLADFIPHVIPVTATPGKNRPKDIFPLVHMVDKRVFPSWFKYAHRYCGPTKGYKGQWEFGGSSNEDELHKLLSQTVMLRRNKNQVFEQLPRKVRVVLPLPLDNLKDYQKADGNFQLWMAQNRPDNMDSAARSEGFYKLELLKQMAVRGKMAGVVDWIKNMLLTEDKLVIFAEHKKTIDHLMSVFKDIAVRVDGSVGLADREKAKHAFQRCRRCGVKKDKHDFDPNACGGYVPDLAVRLYIGSQAAKEGNTLTAAEHVVFVEMWWSSADHEQAEDRAYGRTGDLHGATCWYLIAHGTVEEHIAKIYDLKNQRLTKILDGRELSRDELLTELLYDYKRNG